MLLVRRVLGSEGNIGDTVESCYRQPMNSAQRKAVAAPRPQRKMTLTQRITQMETVLTDPEAKPHHVALAMRLLENLERELERRRAADGVTIVIMEHDADNS